MPTQSIIVYRNPLEQLMWEGFMSGQFFPIIVGIMVFFAVFLAADKFILRRFWGWRGSSVATNIALAVSAAIGVAVAVFMG